MKSREQHMKITIVTPCFNSEDTIEDTLRSIHDQRYPNLEHIIMDGGSTDSTIEIVKKYNSKISKILSKKDNGQYFAIQEGFSYSSGEILCWLNADDIMMPWSLHTVNFIFSNFSEIHWITGVSSFLSKNGLLKKVYNNVSAKSSKAIKNGWYCNEGYGFLQQESMFWSRSLWEKNKGLDCNYSLAADYDLWIRFGSYAQLYTIDIPLAAFRKYSISRSVKMSAQYEKEVKIIRGGLKRIPIIFQISKLYSPLRFLLRLIIYKKTYVISQSMSSNIWRIHKVWRPITGINLSSLLLENKK